MAKSVTPEWVALEIAKLDDSDPEASHAGLDRIWEAIFRAYVAGDCEDPRLCAGVALTGLDRVTRWYA